MSFVFGIVFLRVRRRILFATHIRRHWKQMAKIENTTKMTYLVQYQVPHQYQVPYHLVPGYVSGKRSLHNYCLRNNNKISKRALRRIVLK